MPLDIRERKVLGLDFFEVPGDPHGGAIVLFHGFGADASDLIPISQIYQESPRPTWYFPNGPLAIEIAPGHMGRAWFEIDLALLRRPQAEIIKAFPSSLDSCRILGERFIAELDLPLPKLFLGGFSQGAVLATEIALHAPQQFAGLLLFSGTLINEQKWETLSHTHAGMPFFLSHGTSDPILPFSRAQALENLLIQGGLKGKLHPFRGGHEIPQSVLRECHRFLKEHI